MLLDLLNSVDDGAYYSFAHSVKGSPELTALMQAGDFVGSLPGAGLLLVLTLMLTSKGVAGVSRAALVILLGTVGSFGLPAEPVFVLLAVDQLMDMARTSVNVLGNCLATVVVAKWEGQYDPPLVVVKQEPVGSQSGRG